PPSSAAAADGTTSIASETASLDCDGAISAMTSVANAPVTAHTLTAYGRAGIPVSSAVVGRSDNARSLMPTVLWDNTTRQQAAMTTASRTINTVTLLTTTLPTSKAGPEISGW